MSQLQLMALVCVYVRKANYFQQVFKNIEQEPNQPPPLGFSKEDLLIHGDSVYDIIDKQDHQAIQAELMRAAPSGVAPADDPRMFLCRMNVSRNARRQMRFGDQKVVLIRGHYLSYLPLCSRNEPVFVATCTPIAMPETRECVAQGATNIFTSVHSMDMKFVNIDDNASFALMHILPDDITHREFAGTVCASEQDRSCILLLRLQARSGRWLWVHCVLQVKDNMENMQQSAIVCTCQVLSEAEASVMRANSWLYHYYSMQGKLQYSLAYEAHPRMSSYYQQMLAYQHPHQDAGLYQSYLHSQLSAHPEAAHHLAQAMPAAHVAQQYAFPAAAAAAAAYHHYPVLEHSQWERYDPSYLPHPMLDARLDVPVPTTTERRPPTPPISPRRKLCAPTVVPPTSGSPHRECAPVPVKRRLMAYQQSESTHGGGWSERAPPRPPPQRVPGQYSFSGPASGGGLGGGGGFGGGGGVGGGGGADVLVARRTPPLRLHGPLKGTPSGPELEQETLSWTLSPPWSAGTPEASQRVPDLVVTSQTAVSPPRPADPAVEQQRPALTGWADVCSLDDLSQASSGGGWVGSAPPVSRPGSVSAPCSSPDGSEEDSQHQERHRRAWCQL
ncbi:Neuronal PAS domain-containing protein 4 [Amphibalanus amphitrite]|uniref:Neuronal PAS domain-containing protein 4 n=1 Tax=Amphibalanus amphitrite TaxID=1232801 RepID=A0A6A4W724_AMPAM|nr:Neuronal PAS domain-containing protein 4 [Amphibalanus amphitrite]